MAVGRALAEIVVETMGRWAAESGVPCGDADREDADAALRWMARNRYGVARNLADAAGAGAAVRDRIESALKAEQLVLIEAVEWEEAHPA